MREFLSLLLILRGDGEPWPVAAIYVQAVLIAAAQTGLPGAAQIHNPQSQPVPFLDQDMLFVRTRTGRDRLMLPAAA